MATDTKFHFPPEILSHIISFVPSKASLCNIALCSSQFHSLTVPILYAEIELWSRCLGFQEGFKGLQPLTVLFLTKPKVAQHVRRFTIRDPYNEDEFKIIGNGNRTWVVNGVLKDAILANSHSTKEFEQWMMHVAEDQPDALLAIILPTMIRLEKLDLMLRSNYLYFDRMIRRAVSKEKPFDRQPLFPALTEFMHAASWNLYHQDDQTGSTYWNHQPMSSQYSILFQHFPRIRSIFGHRVAERPDDLIENTSTTYPVLTGASSSLTHFELNKSSVIPQNLCTILKAPKALLTFIYELCTDTHTGSPAFPPGDPVDIILALMPQRKSLENLWIDYQFSDDLPEESNHVYDDSWPLLSKFVCLKNLGVAAKILIALLYPDQDGIPFRRNFSGLLPATLETLHISYRDSESPDEIPLWEDINGFVRGELYQVPRLKKIIIESECEFRRAPLGWKELQNHAKGQGMDLISLSCSEDQASSFWYERGWGMDGSVKWAHCVEDSNYAQMPLVMDWNLSKRERYKICWMKNARQPFYKWHLCHDLEHGQDLKPDLELDDPSLDDEFTDEEATHNQETNEDNFDDQADEGESDDEETNEMSLDEQ